ncbi:Protein CBG27553 [Caenorhabditis briggsae]|uniref:Uncharacterized protein n=2 Tax=Caenorhabditis briggsae TaxID=6238 RepID=A0AAE9FEH3_CAEBR|nr:Protein CBG27553 [Caenorhabditis briggsae]ULT81085.1 hypothetical protein L3Y34_011156 [Caenorhabditis briggsae]UMM40372.1 hypothetical protein L5515_017032 [Caenorhabditis briggsae]CAS00447.1 Protein CBG27553 [Caenorhabditis briggsae]
MKNCWHKFADVRPDFKTCVDYLKGYMRKCAGELLAHVDNELYLELEKQYELEEWLMTDRPKFQGGTFIRKPKNNEEPPTGPCLIVESSA